MSRILRLVQFSAPDAGVDALQALVSSAVVPVNLRHGAESCRVLRSASRPAEFAIVSMWRSPEDLGRMRAAPEYQALVAGIRRLSATDLQETIYEVLA